MSGSVPSPHGIAVESDVARSDWTTCPWYQAKPSRTWFDADAWEVLPGRRVPVSVKRPIAGVLNIVTAAPTRELPGKAMIYGTNDKRNAVDDLLQVR